MIKFIKSIFSKSPENVQIQDDVDDSDFKIVHFPITKRYYPQYQGMWLATTIYGIIKTEDMLEVAKGFDKQQDAEEYIEKYKEQKLMKGVEIINYKSKKI